MSPLTSDLEKDYPCFFLLSPCTLTPAQRINYWAQNFYKYGFYAIVVTRAWTKDLKTRHDTKVAFGERKKVQKFPTHEVHYLPFRPGILDKAYLKMGEGLFRPIFLITKLLDVFLARFSLVLTSYANFLPHLNSIIQKERPEKLLITGDPFICIKLDSFFIKNSISLGLQSTEMIGVLMSSTWKREEVLFGNGSKGGIQR